MGHKTGFDVIKYDCPGDRNIERRMAGAVTGGFVGAAARMVAPRAVAAICASTGVLAPIAIGIGVGMLVASAFDE